MGTEIPGRSFHLPGMGLIRNADAWYEAAIEFAGREGVKIPMKSTP